MTRRKIVSVLVYISIVSGLHPKEAKSCSACSLNVYASGSNIKFSFLNQDKSIQGYGLADLIPYAFSKWFFGVINSNRSFIKNSALIPGICLIWLWSKRSISPLSSILNKFSPWFSLKTTSNLGNSCLTAIVNGGTTWGALICWIPTLIHDKSRFFNTWSSLSNSSFMQSIFLALLI